MDSTLVFEEDAVRIHRGASTVTIPYDRIQDVIVSYASGYTGWFIDCSPKAVLLEVEDVDGGAAEIRGDLAEIAPLAGKLRARIRAVNPEADTGSQAEDRELRLDQKEALSRKERKVGSLGMILSVVFLFIGSAMTLPFWFASSRAAATITAIQEFPKSYSVHYGFSVDGREYRGDGSVSPSEITSVRERGKIEIEYVTFFPLYNRLVKSSLRTLFMLLGFPLLALLLAASLILKSGVVPARVDGRLVAVRRDELLEDHYPWFRALLEEEAAGAANADFGIPKS